MTVEAVVTPLPGAATEPPPAATQSAPRRRFLAAMLGRRPKLLVFAWSLVALAYVLALPAAYVCWVLGFPWLFHWAMEAWWHWAPAALGFLFLFSIPVWVVMAASGLAGQLADISVQAEQANVAWASDRMRETEEEAIARLESTDDAGLLPLLKYSRAQLDAYYAVGLNQTRKSFVNSVLAMWLGFALLLLGVALYVVPVEQLGLKGPTQDFSVLVVGGAALIEFISAMFLWVYRSSTAQLTYFYNRQMHTHSSILCFRIASTMDKARGDEVKRLIVEKVLEGTAPPERIAPAGGAGLRALAPVVGKGG